MILKPIFGTFYPKLSEWVHLVFKSLSPEDAVSYKVMKAGIVVRYDIMLLSIAYSVKERGRDKQLKISVSE